MKAIKQVIPGRDMPVSYLSNGGGFSVEGGDETTRTESIPFFRTSDGVCIIRWRLSWRERLRMAFTGDIWHSLSSNGAPVLLPTKLEAFCPAIPVVAGQISVLMSCRGMFNAVGDAEMGVLRRVIDPAGRVKYVIDGNPESGKFDTENEALAALAKYLRVKNKGKWWER